LGQDQTLILHRLPIGETYLVGLEVDGLEADSVGDCNAGPIHQGAWVDHSGIEALSDLELRLIVTVVGYLVVDEENAVLILGLSEELFGEVPSSHVTNDYEIILLQPFSSLNCFVEES
jgi:hypothetical protein